MISNETIEANISFIRSTVDDVKSEMKGLQVDNRSLRDKIDSVRSELILRIDQVRSELHDRIERVRTELLDKIAQLRTELTDKIEHVRSELTDKIEHVRSELTDKIEHVRSELTDKIEHFRTELTDKIDRLEKKIDQVSADQKTGDEKLGAKIDLLAEKLGQTNVALAKVATMQKVMLWLIGGGISLMGLIEGMIRLGEKFHWF